MNGSTTAPVIFSGGCVYHWVNSNPSIGLPATGGGDIPSFTAINTGSTPITAYITATPVTESYAYIASRSQNTVSVVNTEDNSTITTIPVGTLPYGVAVSSDFHYVYVTNQGSNNVSVISTANNTVIKTISVGTKPGSVTISKDGSRVYVFNTGDNSVSVIDAAIFNVIKTIRGFSGTNGALALSPDGGKLYVSDNLSNIYVVNTTTYTITNNIANSYAAGPNNAITISPDGSRLYISGSNANNKNSSVYVFDTGTNAVSNIITVDNPNNNSISPALAITLSKDGSRLYFVYVRDGTSPTQPSYVAAVNAITGQVLAQDIAVGDFPRGISVSSDGYKVYVTNSGSQGVSVINTGNNTVTGNIDISNPIAVGNFTGSTHCSSSPITYAIIINPTPSIPTIVATGTTAALATTIGTPSASTSFNVTGYKLTAGILVTPPAGYEVSTDNIKFSATLTVGTGGDIPSTPVYTRLAASTPAGSYPGSITLSSSGATNQGVPVSGAVSSSGSLVADRTVYNGDTVPPVNLPGTSCIYDYSSDVNIGLVKGQGIKIPAFTAVNTGIVPIKATVRVSLSSAPYNNISGPLILNQLTGKVWFFSALGDTVISAVATSSQPYALVINHARTKIYVTNKTTGTVTVANQTYSTTPPVPTIIFQPVANIPVGASPEGIVISPDDATLYVVNSADGTVSVIKTKTNTVTATIILNTLNPAGIAISPDGKRLYVANSGSATVSIINTATNTVTGTVPVGVSPQNLVVSPDGSKVYVTNQGSNSISVINTANNAVISVGVGTQPLGITISSYSKQVYIANQGSDNVTVIDALSNSVITTVSVGSFPGGITVSNDGKFVYVTNYKSNDVTIIDAVYNTAIKKFDSDYLGTGGPFTAAADGPAGCATMFTYTVTVLPTPPLIKADGYLSPLTTTFGVPSATTSFTVSGKSLTEGITVTQPTGFEVSTDSINFSPTVKVGQAGNIVATKIYVRLADTTPVGTYSGDIILTSAGAANVTVPTAPSTVTDAVPTIIAGVAKGKMVTCAGQPSASPQIQQFTVKGIMLKGVLSATAPAGFEVSASQDQGYATHIDITDLDASGKATIYVRLSGQSSGSISGNVILSSPTAVQQQVTVAGLVNVSPSGNPIPSQTIASGNTTTAVTFTGTGNNTFNWVNDQTSIGLAANGTGDIKSFTAVNTGTKPVVATIIATPVSVPLAYSANQGSNSVSVIDVSNNKLITTIPVGSSPQEVLINTDGSRIYVANHGTNTISVINTGTNTTIATIQVGNDIEGLSFNADGSRLFVYNAIDGTVSTINTLTNTVLTTTEVDDYHDFLPGTIFSPDGSRAYVFSSPTGTFAVYDTQTKKMIATIPVSLSTVQGLAISPNGKTIYITSGGILSVVDAVTNKVTSTIPLGPQTQGLSFSPDGNTLYVAIGGNNTVAVINTATNTITSTLTTGNIPFGVVTTGGTGCVGTPVTFTITVNPPVPTINASGTLDSLTTIFGVPSPSTNFTVSGTNLNETILVTPPPGFEVSTDDVNFGSTVNVGTGGDVPPTVVYVRIAAGTPVGKYSGDVVLTSLGADDVKVATSPSFVSEPLQTIFVGTVTGSIAACQGSASASPFIQQFKLTGKLLTDNLTVKAPANFEISLDPASGYTNNITLTPSGGSVGPLFIYIRSSASALGNITGNVSLTSNGASPKTAVVRGNVTAVATVKPVADQTVANGDITAAVKFTGTGNTYTWVNDTPGIGLAANGTGNIGAFAAVNRGSTPITATVTVTPVSASLAYIANSTSNTVTVINTQNNQVAGTIPVGKAPYATAVSPDGAFIYVANQNSGSVSKINAVTGVVTNIPVAQGPDGLVVSPDGSTLFVANGASNTVSVVSTAANSVVATINVGIGPLGMVLDPDGKRLYVANRNSTNIYVIDISNSNYNIITKISLLPQQSPEGEALSPDGSVLYVTNYNSRSVSVINTSTFAVIATVTVGANPTGIAVSPDGKTIYVANTGSNAVSVIDAATNTVTGVGISVGKGPEGISVSPDGKLVYVSNALSSSVSIISTATNTVTGTLATGGTPVSIGNFISAGLGCPGAPTTFKIIVNPFVATNITTTGNPSAVNTTYGTPSLSTTFSVSGASLTTGITVTPPKGFEVSLDNAKFSSTVIAGQAGTIGPIPVYIRLASITAVGVYTGDITLSSTGTSNLLITMPNSTVATTPLTITANNKTKITGAVNPVFTATYTGFVNNEGPVALATLPTFVTTALVSSPAGKYPINVSGAASPNYSFIYVPGILTISPTTQALVIPNTFTPNGDGINDTWNIPALDTYPDFTVQIFNRTGQSLFFSNNYPTAWDGTYKGANLPVGTYYYIIAISGSAPVSGPVTLIR